MSEIEQIYGIGPILAKKLIAEGYTTRKSLMKIIDKLPLAAQLDLKYNPKKIIPHPKIEVIEKHFAKYAKKIKHIFVGSYRRLLSTSGDIDIVINRDSFANSTPDQIYSELCKLINKPSIYLFAPFAIGKDKIACFIKSGGLVCKVDFFITDTKEWPFMVFYGTGSKVFNIRMRRVAQKKGYLLNQHGLFDNKTKKRVTGLNSETAIMNFLGVRIHSPLQRSV